MPQRYQHTLSARASDNFHCSPEEDVVMERYAQPSTSLDQSLLDLRGLHTAAFESK